MGCLLEKSGLQTVDEQIKNLREKAKKAEEVKKEEKKETKEETIESGSAIKNDRNKNNKKVS